MSDEDVKPAFSLSGEVVQRFFPREVRFTLPNHQQLLFRPGVQDVPVEVVDNPWFTDNGVVEFKPGEPLPPLVQRAPYGSPAFELTATGRALHAPAPTTPPVVLTPVEEAEAAEKAVQEAESALEVLQMRAAALRSVVNELIARQNAEAAGGASGEAGGNAAAVVVEPTDAAASSGEPAAVVEPPQEPAAVVEPPQEPAAVAEPPQQQPKGGNVGKRAART